MDAGTLTELRNDVSEWLTLTCVITDKQAVVSGGGSPTPTNVSNGMGGVIVEKPVPTGENADPVNARIYPCRQTIPVRDSAANEFQANERSDELIRVELILPYDAVVYLTSQIAVTDEFNVTTNYEVERLQPYTNMVCRHVTIVATGDKP